jgi:hypothetical protein
LSITTAALPGAVNGQSYTGSGFSMTATGGVGAYSWRAVGFPAGMSISPAGLVSGVPSGPGSYRVTFTVTDSASPAHTASRSLSLTVTPSVLIYGPSLWTTFPPSGPTPTEKSIAEAAGYAVVVKDAESWSAMTTAQFRAYNAIVFPDPHCTPEGVATPLNTATETRATWSPAVTGPTVVIGTDPVDHADPADTPGAGNPAPSTLMRNAINFAASGTTTGMYMSLSCYYFSATETTPVPALAGFGTFTVRGQGSSSNTVNVLAPEHAVMLGLNNTNMSNWGKSMHEWFVSYPEDWSALAEETSFEGRRKYIIAKIPSPVIP